VPLGIVFLFLDNFCFARGDEIVPSNEQNPTLNQVPEPENDLNSTVVLHLFEWKNPSLAGLLYPTIAKDVGAGDVDGRHSGRYH